MTLSRILGYRAFISKKNGRYYRVLTVTSPYTEAQKANGCIGNSVDEVFMPDDCQLEITEDDIGKPVVVSYSVSGGRAFVVGIEIVPDKKK